LLKLKPEVNELGQANASAKAEIARLTSILKTLRRRRFGKTSQKLGPDEDERRIGLKRSRAASGRRSACAPSPTWRGSPKMLAKESGAGRDRIIVLVLDNAGWHGEANLKVPDGIRLLFLPPYTPELQPAEHLWEVVDEPIINQHIADAESLDAIIAKRCVQLANDRQIIKGRAGFHWWPKIAIASQSPGNRIILMSRSSQP
jgi:DDE superfamily endonuclease